MIDEMVGQDFLTWLWYRSEAGSSLFRDLGGKEFLLRMEKRVVVQGGEGDLLETATVSGVHSQLREARLGLSVGKKVSRAQIHLEWDGLEYSFVISADDFALGAFKTPKIDRQDNDDPDGLFLEKMYLLEEGLARFDYLYRVFLDLRLSEGWGAEVLAIRDWIKGV